MYVCIYQYTCICLYVCIYIYVCINICRWRHVDKRPWRFCAFWQISGVGGVGGEGGGGVITFLSRASLTCSWIF